MQHFTFQSQVDFAVFKQPSSVERRDLLATALVCSEQFSHCDDNHFFARQQPALPVGDI